MPKVIFYEDEFVICVDHVVEMNEIIDENYTTFEIPQESIDRWKGAMDAWHLVQIEMYNIYHADDERLEQEARAERLRLRQIEDDKLDAEIARRRRERELDEPW